MVWNALLFRRHSSEREGFRREDRQRLTAVRSLATKLRKEADSTLRARTADLRSQRLSEKKLSAPVIEQGFALILESIRRVHGVELYDVQLLASYWLVQKVLAEMQTGEGKTLACAPATFVLALAGQGVHVTTPNAYLAERDFRELAPAFELLGMSIGLLPENNDRGAKKLAYQCDVTYGTGYEFGFDYLRDQLLLQEPPTTPLGKALLARLSGSFAEDSTWVQRSLAHSIVDEADHVLLDDAMSPLVISGGGSARILGLSSAPYKVARGIVASLTLGEDYHVDLSASRVHLTDKGRLRIHGSDIQVPFSDLRRPWAEYVAQALHAAFVLKLNVHYVRSGDDIQIIDTASGRIFSDRTWRDGLHQAVQAKEDVPITSEKQSLAQITRQKFYRLYSQLSGMSGTLVGCNRELQKVYQLRTQRIPRRYPSRRNDLKLRFFLKSEQRWCAVVESAMQMQRMGRPVLVGTRSIQDSLWLSELFRSRGIDHQLLNGVQDADEAQIISRAGTAGQITIATNLAGRGTDIRLCKEASARGGLHVIVGECHPSVRVDNQLVGRAARQNDPGSSQKFVAIEDSIFSDYGGWLREAAARYADKTGEATVDLSTQVLRVQQVTEREQYAMRAAMLRQDLSTERIVKAFAPKIVS